jgi:hypothetical protein
VPVGVVVVVVVVGVGVVLVVVVLVVAVANAVEPPAPRAPFLEDDGPPPAALARRFRCRRDQHCR